LDDGCCNDCAARLTGAVRKRQAGFPLELFGVELFGVDRAACRVKEKQKTSRAPVSSPQRSPCRREGVAPSSLVPLAQNSTGGGIHSSGGSVRTQAMIASRSWSVMRLK
jgi:hypothetical protein